MTFSCTLFSVCHRSPPTSSRRRGSEQLVGGDRRGDLAFRVREAKRVRGLGERVLFAVRELELRPVPHRAKRLLRVGDQAMAALDHFADDVALVGDVDGVDLARRAPSSRWSRPADTVRRSACTRWFRRAS